MRKTSICFTSLKRQILIISLAVLVAVAVLTAFVFMIITKPPFYDEFAKKGVPSDLPKEYGYANYEAQEVCDASVCGNPKIEDKNVFIYLTNPENNEVCIRAEIYTVKFQYDKFGQITGAGPDKLLGKTGFIKPGEYTEFVTLKRKLSDKEPTNIIIKIATYDEKTEESRGFFNINTVFNADKK